MPIIRKLRTVVRSTDATAETDYMVVSVKKMKGSCPGKAKYGTLPIKYYFDKTRSKCINTFEVNLLHVNAYQTHVWSTGFS